MKKVGNKGFLLAETLITTCVIAVLATSLYIYVSKTINNYEKRDNYDNVIDVYKLNNIKVYLDKNWIVSYKPSANSCKDISSVKNTIKINAEKIYICGGNYKEYFFSTNNSNSFKEYVRLLPNNTEENKYTIIANFKDNNGRKETFASLKMSSKG